MTGSNTLLAAKYPVAPQKTTGYLPTEVAPVDLALQGGWPVGGMTEVVCAAGGGLLLTALVRATLRRQGLLALIDGGNAFDLAGVPEAALSRLLWVGKGGLERLETLGAVQCLLA